MPAPDANLTTAGAARPPRVLDDLVSRSIRRPPILFIGLDGADWQQLDPLLAEGAMPHLARLRASAAWGELETEIPTLSPLLWTTMLTGVSPLEHRILDFSRFAPGTGTREPIGSDERRAPAIWNDLSWAGKSVDVVGLWATHPAEPVNGVLVSDRLFGFLNVEASAPAGSTFPESRSTWAKGLLAKTESETDFAALQAYLPGLTPGEYGAHSGAARAYDHPVSALRRILVETRLYGAMAESLLRDSSSSPPDLSLVYLQGTDSIGHVFAPFAPPRQAQIGESDFAHYSAVPELYFREIDALLGRLIALAERTSSTIVVASDHGFYWGDGRPTSFASSATQTAARWHRKQGIWLVRAAGVPPGKAPGGKLRQIYPTLLALAGLPPAAGPAPVQEGERPAPLAGLRMTETPYDYGAVFRALAARQGSSPSSLAIPATAAGAAAFEKSTAEEIAKLRSLGYIGASEATQARAADLAAGSTRTASSWNNEGILLRGERRDAEARAAFEKAIELEPEQASALWNLSELLSAGGGDGSLPGDRERSDDLLIGALAHGLPDGTKEVIARALQWEREGEIPRAVSLLGRATIARPADAELWLYHARYLVQSGACADALTDLGHAARLAPGNSDVFATRALAAICSGDRDGALRDLRRALALAPGETRLRALLAKLEASNDLDREPLH
ncbi:MAG: alkaline phosphatase family protein [Thermoanaerobaculia bacterium]